MTIIYLSAAAAAAPITLGTAGNYGVLTGAGQTLTLGGGLNVAGDVAVGQNGALNLGGINFISGTIYEDSKVTTNNNSLTFVSGGVQTASLSKAISDAAAAGTSAAALTGTAGLAYQNSAINVSGSSIVIKALTNLSENVLNISSLSLTNGTITFDDNGYTGAKFIVNVTGNFQVASTGLSKSVIAGANGATASDILFNIENTGSTVSITGNSTNQIIGTILAPQRNVTVGGGGSLTGALIAGVNNAGKSYTLQTQSTGFNVTELPYTARSGPSGGGGGNGDVPEPSTLALFAGGAIMIGIMRRRQGRS